ncbi:MerR family transcriptional regulator [Caldicellulosiruptoraceae bacterium PP1]
MQYSIKEVSEKTNLSAYTIRYYEQEGLLPNLERDAHGNRIFKESDVEWLLFIRCLRDTGMSITNMKRYVELNNLGDATIEDRREILLNHKKYIEAKIEELNNYLQKINHKIEWYNNTVAKNRKIETTKQK